jgi:site-specific recombinase XerD
MSDQVLSSQDPPADDAGSDAAPQPEASPQEAQGEALRLSLTELKRRVGEFLTDYLEGKSDETVGTYRRSLNGFEKWFVQQKGRFRFQKDDVRAYKKYLIEERGLSQASISTYLTALRRLCQYLVDAGLLEENPAVGVKGNRRPESHSRAVLTETDIEALEAVLGTATPIACRDRACVYLMLYGGLAEIELVRIDKEDLEQTLMGHFVRVQGKGRTVKDERVPLDEKAAGAVYDYLDAREGSRERTVKPGDPVFVSHGHRSRGQRLNTRSVRSRVNDLLKKAGIKRRGLTPPSLTHTAALLWLNDGMEVDEVKSRMRHGTLDTKMIYYKRQGLLKRDPEELKEIGE